MRPVVTALTFVAAIAITTAANATTIFLDTTPLQSAGGTWYLDFQLSDADSGLNTALIENLTLGGGTHLATPPDVDQLLNATGPFPNYTLLDGSQALIPFLPGTHVQFDLTLTSNYVDGGFPDTFSWAVLDAAFTPIVDGSGLSLSIALDGSGFEFNAATQQYDFITPHIVTDNQTPVPEPATGLLLVTGGALLARVRRRR